MLDKEYGVSSDIWSVTSFNELARDGQATERLNRLHPEAPPKQCYVPLCLGNTEGPAIAAADYMRLYAEQIRGYVPNKYHVLGTDGFGRSDTRNKLRKFFEVDRYYVTISALKALAELEALTEKDVADAIEKYGIDPDKPNPMTV